MEGSAEVKKVVRDGKVAVLVSPGFGAGWYSWNHIKATLFDPDLVAAVEAKDFKKAEAIAAAKWPDAYAGGVEDLVVRWIPEGAQFRIDEFDGSESLVLCGDDSWVVA